MIRTTLTAAGLVLLIPVAAAFSTPIVAQMDGHIRQCNIQGVMTFQHGACPEGTLIKEWNGSGSNNSTPSLPPISTEERAAMERIGENTRRIREARERSKQVPRLDTESHCDAVASAGSGYSASIYNVCLSNEQQSYNDLQRRYSQAPRPLREHCQKVADVGEGGSYSILQTCIEQEMQASGSRPGFRY